MRDRLVLAGSASKAYAMTGWRCGWMVGPKPVVAGRQRAAEPRDVERQLDHAEGRDRRAHRTAGSASTTCCDEYQRRRDQLLAWLAEEPRLRCVDAAGRVLSVPVGVATFLSPERHPHVARLRRRAAARGARRHDAGRGVRRARVHPAVVRDVARRLREGATRLIVGSPQVDGRRSGAYAVAASRLTVLDPARCAPSSAPSTSGRSGRRASSVRHGRAHGAAIPPTSSCSRRRPREIAAIAGSATRRARRSCRAAPAPATPAAPCRSGAASSSASSA